MTSARHSLGDGLEPPVVGHEPASAQHTLGDWPVIVMAEETRAPLRFSDSIAVARGPLGAGEYSLRGAEHVVAIAHRSLGELAHACGRDRVRLLEHVERLRARPVRALVIDADMDGVLARSYSAEVHPAAVVGTLIKFSSDWQVPVWFAGDARNAALLVERTLLRVWKQQRSVSDGR